MHDLTGRTIALIGGAGFIGHSLALELRKRGAVPIIIDSLAVNNYYHFREHRDIIPSAAIYLGILEERLRLLRQAGIRLIELDARDYHALSKSLVATQPDTIIQLAAVSHADKSNRDPMATFDHSLRTLENALDVARSPNLKIRHFIYFSSSMVYGDFKGDSVTEQTPCDPVGIYGALKLAGERMVIAYHQVFGVPYTIVRPSALYGPRCVSRRVGQIFIENALQGVEIVIQGDGSDRLDFTYIDDLVSGIMCCISSDASLNQTFNLTFGESRSLAEMAAIMHAHMPAATLRYVPKDRLQPARGTLNIDKARELLSYNPSHPLESGFVRYIDWYRSVWCDLHEQSTRRMSDDVSYEALHGGIARLVAGRVPTVAAH